MSVSITLGATVIITREDDSQEVYIVRGGKPLVFEEPNGAQHTGVLDEPYKEIRIVNPPHWSGTV